MVQMSVRELLERGLAHHQAGRLHEAKVFYDQALKSGGESGQSIVLCSPIIRSHLKNLIDRFIPSIVVLSHNEVSSSLSVQSLGTVRLGNAN